MGSILMENATKTRHNQSQFDFKALKKLIERNGQHKLTVITDSMEPLIKVGEEIILTKIDKNQLNIFDILVFEQAGRLNSHFLTQIDHKKNCYVTRSLKNPDTNDYPIQWEQILGRVSTKNLNWIQKLKILWAELRS